ncbi:MAG: AEC family transporter [Chitinophagaceae bacterium]|nr:MAG: AEC family transporter [Chitinophagaceae bacterium]
MTNFILIGVCILAGMLFRQSKVLPADAHKGINAWIIYLALPAVSLHYIPQIKWSTDLLLPVAGPLLIWLGGWLYIRGYSSFTKLPKPAEGGLKLTAGLSNTSFVGFPLIAAWFSEKELGIAIICDQVTFLLLATAGIIVAMNSADGHTLRLPILLKRLFTFPPFLACLAALIVPHFISLEPLDPLFLKMAGTVGPLALFSIGLQLQFKGWKEDLKHISVTLLYKLFLAPLLVLLLALLMNADGNIARITVFEAAMPTLLTSGIIAEQYHLRPTLANRVIGIGIVLSFLTTAIWYYIITAVL